MKLCLPLMFLLGSFSLLLCQTKNETVVAEQGDGIFSMLRKQGLDPVKYYGDFLEMNADSLVNGSEIVLGRTYMIPKAADSFKEMGLIINVDDASEKSIFEEELATFDSQGDKLKNAVIYLMASAPQQNEVDKDNGLKVEVLKSIAKELLLNGAKVYLLEGADVMSVSNDEDESKTSTESPMADLDALYNYVDVINKEFLKNSGKRRYQRLLVIDLANEEASKKYHTVAVFHDDSAEDEKFAQSMRQIFNKSKILDDSKDFTAIFAQKNNLFLAKNALPPLTYIELGGSEDPTTEGRIKGKPDKKWLTNIITNGIVNDYVQLEFED